MQYPGRSEHFPEGTECPALFWRIYAGIELKCAFKLGSANHKITSKASQSHPPPLYVSNSANELRNSQETHCREFCYCFKSMTLQLCEIDKILNLELNIITTTH